MKVPSHRCSIRRIPYHTPARQLTCISSSFPSHHRLCFCSQTLCHYHALELTNNLFWHLTVRRDIGLHHFLAQVASLLILLFPDIAASTASTLLHSVLTKVLGVSELTFYMKSPGMGRFC